MHKKPKPHQAIAPVDYAPPGGYRSDFEVFSIAEFRKRVSAEHLDAPLRVGFHMLIYITEGHCTHSVDFERIRCAPGSLLTVHPGQVQQYELRAIQWQGWMALFLPEFLNSSVSTSENGPKAFGEPTDLPTHSVLDAREQEAVEESFRRMADDAQRHAGGPVLDDLMRSQLLALCARVNLARSREKPSQPAALRYRFQRYRDAVEQHFSHRSANIGVRLSSGSIDPTPWRNCECKGARSRALVRPRSNGDVSYAGIGPLIRCHPARSADRPACGREPAGRQWMAQRQAEWPPEYRRSRWIDIAKMV